VSLYQRLALCLLLTGCAGSQLRSRVTVLQAVVKKAWDNGAYKCAPRELAMAEAHTAFAAKELDQGDYYRARQELTIADQNAREAIRRSPKEKCNPEVAVAPPEPKKKVVVQRIDTDSDGLFDDEDACPKEPEDKDGFQDEDGCPEPDNDNDGILDGDDQCPLKAEDIDQFEDKDGCPEADNDKDGLADGIDKCPNEAEDADNFEDDDGCPDTDNDKDRVVDYPTPNDKCPNEFAETPDGCPQKYQLIVVTAERIELKQTIYFDYRKATIKPVSFPLLDEVALALQDHATITVRIEGHTDSRGSDKFNLKLSQARAASVRQYLVGRGIAPARMDAKGFGETVPIADNRTEAGRDQNRRVEFVITKSE
jgi:outer membrane protein OmpA-like peptidoglycan-associated protein